MKSRSSLELGQLVGGLFTFELFLFQFEALLVERDRQRRAGLLQIHGGAIDVDLEQFFAARQLDFQELLLRDFCHLILELIFLDLVASALQHNLFGFLGDIFAFVHLFELLELFFAVVERVAVRLDREIGSPLDQFAIFRDELIEVVGGQAAAAFGHAQIERHRLLEQMDFGAELIDAQIGELSIGLEVADLVVDFRGVELDQRVAFFDRVALFDGGFDRPIGPSFRMDRDFAGAFGFEHAAQGKVDLERLLLHGESAGGGFILIRRFGVRRLIVFRFVVGRLGIG